MADICVIYAKEDEDVARKLVSLLRYHWDVWWARDITHADWEQKVKASIKKSKALVPVFSPNTEKKRIFKDELKYADENGLLIFPFFIDKAEAPLGFGGLNRTEAYGWNGDASNPGLRRLKEKIAAELPETREENKSLKRLSMLKLQNKTLPLPCFLFSLSTHETQIQPDEGVKLFQFLEPSAVLISAYDAWNYLKKSDAYLRSVENLRRSNCVLFLDSGNYEAYRKNDRYSRKNKDGWRRARFRQMASRLSPDVAFAYDIISPTGGIDEIAEGVISSYRADQRVIRAKDLPLCPIIHLPDKFKGTLSECASQIGIRVGSELDPILLAIPERELGNGLIERFKTVRDIRLALNSLGKYLPIHLLGTGNPLSIIAFAAAGADSFDGLEWCRTVADYDNGNLYHFQHFDCFRDRYLTRVQSQKIRKIIENPHASYGAQVASYNVDFFTEFMRTVRDMVISGQVEHLLKTKPDIGLRLFQELKK